MQGLAWVEHRCNEVLQQVGVAQEVERGWGAGRVQGSQFQEDVMPTYSGQQL